MWARHDGDDSNPDDRRRPRRSSRIRRAIEQSGLVATSRKPARPKRPSPRSSNHVRLPPPRPRPAGTTGTELTRRLRAAGNLTPVVLVTGQQKEELLQRAVDAGVTDFFPKGDLSPRRLALRIRFAIRNRRAEAESAKSLAAATQAARARDDILAVVSHDLRGPLHAISLACEALHEEVTGSAARYLERSERASLRPSGSSTISSRERDRERRAHADASCGRRCGDRAAGGADHELLSRSRAARSRRTYRRSNAGHRGSRSRAPGARQSDRQRAQARARRTDRHRAREERHSREDRGSR